MAYEPQYTKPYIDGWKNLPEETTPIKAEVLNAMDNAFVAVEEQLEKTTTIYDEKSINLGRKENSNVGNNSIAYGNLAVASGMYSQSFGNNNTASGTYSHAEGCANEASGESSHVEGWSNISSGHGSHAEGKNTEATMQGAHSEGTDSKANAMYSHAEGYMTTVETSGIGGHAEGYSTFTSGVYGHAEGQGSRATGSISHAEGIDTTASGVASHAEGYGTKSSGNSQHVQGKYNLEDVSGKYAHIVGGGSSDTDRKNIHTLDWNGNAEFAGEVKDGNGNTLSKKMSSPLDAEGNADYGTSGQVLQTNGDGTMEWVEVGLSYEETLALLNTEQEETE